MTVRIFSGNNGSILMESVLVLPLLLAMVMGALQFAHIYIGKQLVNYAAYSAARATLSVPRSSEQTVAENATKRILCWLILPAESEKQGVVMPDYNSKDIHVEITLKNENWTNCVDVKFAFPLIFPLAAPMIYWGMNLPAYLFEGTPNNSCRMLTLAGSSVPHLQMRERCALVKPYIIK